MYKSILLPIDLGHPSSWETAMPVAVELAETFRAKLHLVSVVPALAMPALSSYLPADFEANALTRAGDELKAFADEHVPDGIQGQCHLAHGVVRQEIVKAADTLDCDLIIMAPHRSEMADFFISPVTEFVVSHSTRSVMVVRK